MRFIFFIFLYICVHIGLLLDKNISESLECQNAYPNALRPVKTEAIFPMFDKRFQATAVQPVSQPVAQSDVPAIIFDIRLLLEHLMKPLEWFRNFFFTVKRRVKRSQKASERASELVVYDSNTSPSTVVIAHCEDLRNEYMRLQQLHNEATQPCFFSYRISLLNIVGVASIFTAFAGYTYKLRSNASVSSCEYEYESNFEQSTQVFNGHTSQLNTVLDRANESIQLPITALSASELIFYDSNASRFTVMPVYRVNVNSEPIMRQLEMQPRCSGQLSGVHILTWALIFAAITDYNCKLRAITSVNSSEYKCESGLEQSQIFNGNISQLNTVLNSASDSLIPVATSFAADSNRITAAIQPNEAGESNEVATNDLTVKPLVIRKNHTSFNATISANSKREEATQAGAVDELTVKPLRIVKKSASSSATISSAPKREEASFANNVTDKTALNNHPENQFSFSKLSIDDIVKLCRPCSYDDSCTDECYEDQVISEEKDLGKDMHRSEPADVYEISNRILAEGFDSLNCDDIRDLTDVAARLPRPELPCSDYRGVWGYDLYSTSYSEHFETFKEVFSVCGMVASTVDRGINSLQSGHRLSEDIVQVRELIRALYCIPENKNFRFTNFKSMQDDFEAFRFVIGAGRGRKMEERYIHEANDMADSLLEQWSTFMNERTNYLLGLCVNTCCIIEKYRDLVEKDQRYTLHDSLRDFQVY